MEFAINILKAIENIRNPFFDTFFGLITRIGEEVVVFALICLFYWCLSKDTAYKLGFAFFASGIAVQGLKVSFCIPRPFVIDSSLKPVTGAIEAATGYSFPSGHTQSATALFGYLAMTFKRVWIKLLCVFVFLLVAFSRMYLGVHTIFDVTVSILITFLCVYLINRFSGALLCEKNAKAVSLVLGAISVFLCAYSLILALLGHAEIAQINDCFKSGGAGLAFAIGYYFEKKYIRFEPKCKSVPLQAAKLVIGVAGALFFKSVIKLISPGSLVIDFLRYFLTILWVVAIYPLIFTKILNRMEKKTKND